MKALALLPWPSDEAMNVNSKRWNRTAVTFRRNIRCCLNSLGEPSGRLSDGSHLLALPEAVAGKIQSGRLLAFRY